MGWNNGYKIFESTVVVAYNLGTLDLPLLRALMEPYRGSDIDSGGSRDLESNDGKCVMRIVIEIFERNIPDKPAENCSDEEWDDYNEAVYSAFSSITKDEFGWN